ncbi:restriction endonuclease [Acinetobacter proteolyticus]|uniref:restriction endonuclease n=1 Tax=Acinetobacter proteolyticus TaxID=1776741 RepID=UPI003D9637D4
MVKNNGRAYEEFVQSIYKAIIFSEQSGISKQQNIEVEINKVLTDKNGTQRQFDIYWEYRLAGHLYKTVIECKDYASKISIEKIDAYIGKLQDFPGITGLYATKKGYQKGALTKANQHNIDLLIVREQNDTDWKDKDGTPLIREVHIGITAILPARILDFNMLLPKDSKPLDPKSLSGLNTEIIITDEENNEQYSLFDLQDRLLNEHPEDFGTFEKKFLFKGNITTPDIKVDIVGYTVKYEIPQPAKQKLQIDFAAKLIGVVEYLQRGEKSLIFNDHIKQRQI